MAKQASRSLFHPSSPFTCVIQIFSLSLALSLSPTHHPAVLTVSPRSLVVGPAARRSLALNSEDARRPSLVTQHNTRFPASLDVDMTS